MKKIIVFLIAILFISQIYAQNDEIFYSESILLDLELKSDFELVADADNYRIDFVKAYFQFYPEDDFNQEVIDADTNPEAELIDDSYLFYWKAPSLGVHKYSFDSKIRTYNHFKEVDKKISFPIEIKDPELIQYLEPSKKIDINNDIIAQASELAEGEDDLFKVVFNLASWTKQNINYSLTTYTAEASQKASWVLDNRYGVCDELTNLFIAMNRALGIPARFVSGISYSNSELFQTAWGLHGWAEVYFPEYGWVSFDPTYGQFGQLDATHIKLRDSIDSDKSSTRFEWQSINIDLNPKLLETDVSVISQDKKIANLIDIEVKTLSRDVGFGSYNIVEAQLRNKKDYYVAFELSLAKPKEVRTINEPIKYVLLEPNNEKSVYWIVKIDEDLSKNSIYTFPLEAYNSLGYSGEGSFTAARGSIMYSYSQILKLINNFKAQEEKVYSRNVEIDCIDPVVYVNETFKVECVIENKGNVFLKNLNVCLKECEKIDLGISQSKVVRFETMVKQSGEQEIPISAKNTDVNKVHLLRIIAEDKPTLSIEKVSYPEVVEYGPEFEINFELWKHSMAKPQDVDVIFIFNNKETSWHLEELESNRAFNIKLDKTLLDPKDNSFKIQVDYKDKQDNLFTVNYGETIELKEPGTWVKILMWLGKLSRDIDKFVENIGS